MPRPKTQSEALKKGEERVQAMERHNIELDLNNGVSRAAYATKVQDLRTKLEIYNAKIAEINQIKQEIAESESELNDFSENILMGVAVVYGKQSKQYEDLGGTRKSKGGWIDRE
jgi:hypothetical protein